MVDSTTITIRLSSELKDKLARLAAGTRRSKSFLAAEAVSAYVDRELEIVEGIQRALADIGDDSKWIAHDEAMDKVDAAIEAVASRNEAARRRKA
jgi:predicted transcriptional regulator